MWILLILHYTITYISYNNAMMLYIRIFDDNAMHITTFILHSIHSTNKRCLMSLILHIASIWMRNSHKIFFSFWFVNTLRKTATWSKTKVNVDWNWDWMYKNLRNRLRSCGVKQASKEATWNLDYHQFYQSLNT